MPAVGPMTLATSMDDMRIQSQAPQSRHTSDHPRRASAQEVAISGADSSSSSSSSQSLCITMPDLEELLNMREKAFASQDDQRKSHWCKEVLRYVEQKLDENKISDPTLVSLIDQVMATIDRLASTPNPRPQALYLRGDLRASGSFPSYHRKDLKSAFNDFELSARMGYSPSWFRIGRDYEVLGDMSRARDAYERGCSVQDVGCIYRMGMANLLGQLELGKNHEVAIPLLKESADLSNIDTPQPSYVYGMLLAGEFSHVEVSTHLFVPAPDPQRPQATPSLESDARRRIQRAAYLNFAPAQYRCGWLHEHAMLECTFDPLLSVQYYSLASQGGEIEADLALSKWFLCGAEGCFDKNECLAFTFADKAAAKGLPSAEFAMGYYFEVGVGCEQDLEIAKKWYRRAAGRGNNDAQERLNALAGPEPAGLSRQQHEVHVDTQLQRKRTEAKMLSDKRTKQFNPKAPNGKAMATPPVKSPPSAPTRADGGPSSAAQNISSDLRRKNTMRMVEEVAGPPRRGAPPNSQFVRPNRPPAAPPMPVPSTRPMPPAQPPTQRPIARPAPAVSARPPPPPSPRPVPRPRPPPTDNKPKKDIPVKSSASMGADDKVYETFGEMGFASAKAKVSVQWSIMCLLSHTRVGR